MRTGNEATNGSREPEGASGIPTKRTFVLPVTPAQTTGTSPAHASGSAQSGTLASTAPFTTRPRKSTSRSNSRRAWRLIVSGSL